MLGCPYGLGSVVVTFNRYPTMVTAAQRRLLGLLTGAYFDDIICMDVAATSQRAKELGNWLYATLGTPPKPKKSFPMQAHRPFLGSVPDLSSIDLDGQVVIAPREASRRQVREDIALALSTGTMTSGQASKTRGKSGWVATNSFGRIGRLGTSVLKELQYRPAGPLTLSQRHILKFHQDLIMQVPSRHIQVVKRHSRRHVVVYSDAEYAPGSGQQPRLGWVIFEGRQVPHHYAHHPHHNTPKPIGQSMDLPPYVTDTWGQRHQQIFPAESAALPLATWSLASHLQGTDVTWFIDNEAAASAGIRGASDLPEVDIMMQVAHLLWLHLDMRVWIEWIDTHSNPSDGLSRDGYYDAWTIRQRWQLTKPADPPWTEDLQTPQPLFTQLMTDIGRRVRYVAVSGDAAPG